MRSRAVAQKRLCNKNEVANGCEKCLCSKNEVASGCEKRLCSNDEVSGGVIITITIMRRNCAPGPF